MKLQEIFADKAIKQKAKVGLISNLLITKKLKPSELISYASKALEVELASCIESLEFASKKKPEIIDESTWKFICKQLRHEVPRIKWESAKVIANVAFLYSNKLGPAISQLLVNAEDKGTVVRWASATALGEILKLKSKYNKDLIPAIEAISKGESDSAVKKKYVEALKKVVK